MQCSPLKIKPVNILATLNIQVAVYRDTLPIRIQTLLFLSNIFDGLIKHETHFSRPTLLKQSLAGQFLLQECLLTLIKFTLVLNLWVLGVLAALLLALGAFANHRSDLRDHIVGRLLRITFISQRSLQILV